MKTKSLIRRLAVVIMVGTACLTLAQRAVTRQRSLASAPTIVEFPVDPSILAY